MARYIDADDLKQKKVYSVDRHEFVVPVAAIDWQPAADVVPKSEFEMLELEYAGFTAGARHSIELLKAEFAKTKIEVAREIFEEIERTLDNYHSAYLPVGEITPYACYEYGLGDALAELKKKYTEVENERKAD